MVAALLFDGLKRAYEDAEIGSWMQQNMSFVFGSSHTLLEQCESMPDVVYLDPMFPHREKSALVKKEMRVFQALVGADTDADDLLEFAYPLASKRVVVKTPRLRPIFKQSNPQHAN